MRDLAANLPPFVEGQAVPCLAMANLPATVEGIWSLWQIAVRGRFVSRPAIVSLVSESRRPCFLAHGTTHMGAAFIRSIGYYRQLGGGNSRSGHAGGLDSHRASPAGPFYEQMVRQQQRQLQREQEKQDYAFAARRRAINRVGLPTVRQYRLTRLVSEEEAWQKEFSQRSRCGARSKLGAAASSNRRG